MVAEDRYCNDILIQLSAIESSVKSLSMHILENHMYSCITDSIEKRDTEVVDELMSLFKRFNKQLIDQDNWLKNSNYIAKNINF